MSMEFQEAFFAELEKIAKTRWKKELLKGTFTSEELARAAGKATPERGISAMHHMHPQPPWETPPAKLIKEIKGSGVFAEPNVGRFPTSKELLKAKRSLPVGVGLQDIAERVGGMGRVGEIYRNPRLLTVKSGIGKLLKRLK